jgi:hypothetical protein
MAGLAFDGSYGCRRILPVQDPATGAATRVATPESVLAGLLQI